MSTKQQVGNTVDSS